MNENASTPNASELPELVLLPGLDGTGLLFKPLLAALPAELRTQVITYPADQPLSLAEHAELVLRQMPDRPVVILAESFSGLVALALLAMQEERIRRVLFVATFAEPPRPLLLSLAPLIRWSGPAARFMPSWLLRQLCLGRDASANDLALLRHALAAVPAHMLAHRLGLITSFHPGHKARFTTPCCYLQARQDRLVPPAAADWFRRHFQYCDLESVHGPHFLLQARPQGCAEWVMRKLA